MDIETPEKYVDRLFAEWAEPIFPPGQEARDKPDMDATDRSPARSPATAAVPATIEVTGQELVDPHQEHLRRHAEAKARHLARHGAWEARVRDLEKLPLDSRSRIDLRVSPEFKAWVRSLADHMGASITVTICSALVAQARASQFYRPVPARYNRRDETPDTDSDSGHVTTRIALPTL